MNTVGVAQTGEPPPTPTDRSKDSVYRSTTNVVRAVMDMSKGVHQAKAEQYVELVKVHPCHQPSSGVLSKLNLHFMCRFVSVTCKNTDTMVKC